MRPSVSTSIASFVLERPENYFFTLRFLVLVNTAECKYFRRSTYLIAKRFAREASISKPGSW
jgi:hypothetical protein